MITNKVLDKAIIIGEVWIYARLMSRLKRSLQLKVEEYTLLFSFPRRQTSCAPCDSGFKFSSVLLKWLEVCKTQDGLQRHKWLLDSSKILILVLLSSLGGCILGNKASFHSTGLKVLHVALVPCLSTLGVHWAAPRCSISWLPQGLCWSCTIIWAWYPDHLKDGEMGAEGGMVLSLRRDMDM